MPTVNATLRGETGVIGVWKGEEDMQVLRPGQIVQECEYAKDMEPPAGPFEDQEAAVARLRSAAELAAGQGSRALLRRCEEDLSRRGVRGPVPGVLPAG